MAIHAESAASDAAGEEWGPGNGIGPCNWSPTKYDKVVVVVVDALRWDFLNGGAPDGTGHSMPHLVNIGKSAVRGRSGPIGCGLLSAAVVGVLPKICSSCLTWPTHYRLRECLSLLHLIGSQAVA